MQKFFDFGTVLVILILGVALFAYVNLDPSLKPL